MSETPAGQPSLAGDDRRRETNRRGRPGRTHGGDYDIQRGWPNPNSQLFGEVTSRTCRDQFYDRLTNTQAPKGTDLSVHSAQDLDWVAQELNDRPRKRLAFKKPIEL